MTKHTRRAMRKIKAKLDVLIDMENSHCGHDDAVQEAVMWKRELLALIRDEIEALAVKGQIQ